MTRVSRLAALVLCTSSAMARPLAAQQSATQPQSTGLFFGGGMERNEISTSPGAFSSANASATGASVVMGYGFTRTWSLYAHAGKATFVTSAGDDMWAGSFGLGARANFPSIGSAIVPFVQAEISNRLLSQDVRINGVSNAVFSSRYLPAAGAGLNLRLVSAAALSGSVLWSAGSFGSTSGSSFQVTKPLVHLGFVVFPGK